MISKLHKKLQTTTQRITVEPRHYNGKQLFCRLTVLCAAALSAAPWAQAETRFVQPAAYEQSSVQSGVVPVVRIDAVQESSNSSTNFVQPVAYNTPAPKRSENSVETSAAPSTLKWVPINSPEARQMQTPSSNTSVKPASAAVSGTRSSFVTPIPAVMPRCPRVRTVSNEEESVLPLESTLDAPSDLIPDGDAGLSLDEETPMVPADTSSEDLNKLLPEDTSDAQKPGAIGNNDGDMMNQGGLNQNTNASENGSVEEEAPVQNQLPRTNGPDAKVNVEPLTPAQREPSESITMRQINEDEYDMPCESTEPMHRITDITNDIDLHDTKITPKSCPLASEDDLFPAREFAGTNVTWTASNLCSNPLYFQQPALERYGHSIGPLQPVLSGAQFLITIPAMPMLMAIDPPNECQYALGYYRPGSCAPFKWDPIPFSMRGAMVEGGVATALVFLIP